jgi:hypothetical protein
MASWSETRNLNATAFTSGTDHSLSVLSCEANDCAYISTHRVLQFVYRV